MNVITAISMAEWVSYAPLLLTIVGWWFVNYKNDQREARKEYRSLVDASKKTVLEISTQVRKYYQDASSNLAPEIKWALDALEIDLLRIPDYKRGDYLLISYVNFTDACTGGEFEQSTRQPIDVNSLQIQNVIQTRNALLDSLEKWFSNKYKNI